MLKEIVIFGIMLCPEVENNICIEPESGTNTDVEISKFVTAVTPWKKLKQNANYISDENRTIEKR